MHTLWRAALQVCLETEEHLKIANSRFFFLCLWVCHTIDSDDGEEINIVRVGFDKCITVSRMKGESWDRHYKNVLIKVEAIV